MELKGKNLVYQNGETKAVEDETKPENMAVAITPGAFESVELTIEALVGEATLSVKELKSLSRDAVLALDAGLNEAVVIRLNGMNIARGELVAVGDKFGVRITEVSK